MQWPNTIVHVLKKYDVRFINYVPDAMGERLLKIVRDDKDFDVLPLTREEEGVGVVCGQSLAGRRGVLLMPTSGIGNSINAIASLPIPYRIPVPMIIGFRGDLGEFNATQVMMGQALPDILRALRIPYFTLRREDEVEVLTEGFLRITYATESPAALLISTQLAGWKE
ncbi:MAG: decarboxylase [SAR324 cluster bacterium]|nr:decarboxylase [SAR324 cluster bacterium]